MDKSWVKEYRFSEVFSHEKELFVLPVDILNFLEMNMIGQAVITAYIAHLHDILRERGGLDLFAFVDPSRTHNCERPKFITYIVDRLKEGKSDRLFLIPYNPGGHLLLTTIYENEIYVLDSLSRPFHYKAWENTMISAVRTFNVVTGVFNKPPKLTYLEGVPKQSGEIECGYFVMRYMKEIVNDDSLSFSSKWAIKSRKLEFTQQEIDEMRIELCEYLENLV